MEKSNKIKVVFYFTRHGHSYSNFMMESSDDIILWKLLNIGKIANNSMLTDIGIGRSINVGIQLSHLLPKKYVLMSSPLKRALLTAHFQYNIHRKNNYPIYIVPHIN
jgi:broad specificity phosphatase PhoE